MAIDTLRKRRSAATVLNPWNPPSVVADSLLNFIDRKHIAWGYAASLGILHGDDADEQEPKRSKTRIQLPVNPEDDKIAILLTLMEM